MSRFSFKDTDDSQDGRGREETIVYSSLRLLIAPLANTRMLLDEIYHLIEIPFD